MKTDQIRWAAKEGWKPVQPGFLGRSAQLVLVFGATGLIQRQDRLSEIRTAYPAARILACSTSGGIFGTLVLDDSLVVTAIAFEHTGVKGARVRIGDFADTMEAGRQLSHLLDKEDLIHVFLLSDGLRVNGSDLVKGVRSGLPPGVTVTGGLSGDGERFQTTLVALDDTAEENAVAAVGLYGDSLEVSYGSVGGFKPFGPERLITRTRGNVLYELDGKPALELYKRYLGPYAAGLPATGLLFPLYVRPRAREEGVVRTILAVNEEEQTMTFAGDIPEGAMGRLMTSNHNSLIAGAEDAAKVSMGAVGPVSPDLAVLISCVGRRLILKQRVEEELEAVRNVLGESSVLTGFYSYGEISPSRPGAQCELHNQTMTITAFWEKRHVSQQIS